MRSAFLVLALSTGLLACSSDDTHPPVSGARSRPLPECPELDTTPCDTRAGACQRRLLALAACMYGVERAPDVPIRVVSERQLLEELQGNAGDESEDAEDTADLPHVERALVELQLLAAGALTEGGGATAELIERVDGVYQDAERGIALVDRGRPKDDPETAAVLVHEFVHALQDDEYDLAEWQQARAHDVDSALAVRSVSEGQATYAQFRVIHAMLGYDLSRFELSSTLDDFRSRVFKSAHDDPSPYLASFTTFPYAAGVGAAARAWSATGRHFAERQFIEPPLTSLMALGESYGLDLAPPDPRDLSPPELADGYTLVDETRLGAFVLELFLHRQGFDLEESRALALDWQTDRLWVYSAPEQRTAFLWQVELQSASFAELDASPSMSGLVREHVGRRLFIAGSDNPPEFLLAAGRAFVGTID